MIEILYKILVNFDRYEQIADLLSFEFLKLYEENFEKYLVVQSL